MIEFSLLEGLLVCRCCSSYAVRFVEVGGRARLSRDMTGIHMAREGFAAGHALLMRVAVALLDGHKKLKSARVTSMKWSWCTDLLLSEGRTLLARLAHAL